MSYYPLIFVVKNTNLSPHLTSSHPCIIIGEAHIPINMIHEMKKGKFEGFVRIKMRNVQEIGKLKVKIVINDLNAANSVANSKKDLDNSINLNVKFAIKIIRLHLI